jgi:GNAT superfamily N-acetyltransferase
MPGRGIMETRLLNYNDSIFLFQQVASIHIQEIHFGVLPLLGRNFLAQLNREMTRAPYTGVWVVIENGQVLGFVSGCADLNKMYRFIFMHSFLPLLKHAGVAIFHPRFLKKVPSLFLYPFRHQKSQPEVPSQIEADSAELLAIAVSPSMQGKGVGKILIKALEDGLREWNVTKCYYVATNIEEVGSNAFYRSQGFTPCGTTHHHDLILQKYRKEL